MALVLGSDRWRRSVIRNASLRVPVSGVWSAMIWAEQGYVRNAFSIMTRFINVIWNCLLPSFSLIAESAFSTHSRKNYIFLKEFHIFFTSSSSVMYRGSLHLLYLFNFRVFKYKYFHPWNVVFDVYTGHGASINEINVLLLLVLIFVITTLRENFWTSDQ